MNSTDKILNAMEVFFAAGKNLGQVARQVLEEDKSLDDSDKNALYSLITATNDFNIYLLCRTQNTCSV